MLVFFFLCSMFSSLLGVGLPVRSKICLKSQCEHLADAVEDILNRCFSINLSHSNPVADLSQRPTCATQQWLSASQHQAFTLICTVCDTSVFVKQPRIPSDYFQRSVSLLNKATPAVLLQSFNSHVCLRGWLGLLERSSESLLL